MTQPIDSHAAGTFSPAPAVPTTPALWFRLRQYTTARIALGRAGGSLPTRALLDFNLDQALARDAVHAPFDADALAAEMRALPENPDVLVLNSVAENRSRYLQRPDLGRQLSAESAAILTRVRAQKSSAAADTTSSASNHPSIAIMVSDGLSALAAQNHAVSVLRELLPRLRTAKIKVTSLAVIRFGRVGIMDHVGAELGATLALILLGERPGLGAPDSLSAYFTFRPDHAHTDADRNCVSNIREAGITPVEASIKLAAWLNDALATHRSGVMLKEPAASALAAAKSSAALR